MTVLAQTAGYARVEGVLWHDSGLHVVALPPGPDAEVLVLGGGGAALWRLLQRPQTSSGLLERLERDGMDVPDVESVTRCLDDLVALGLLEATAPREAP